MGEGILTMIGNKNQISSINTFFFNEKAERHGGLFFFFSDFNGLIFVLVCCFFWVWLCVYVCVFVDVCKDNCFSPQCLFLMSPSK